MEDKARKPGNKTSKSEDSGGTTLPGKTMGERIARLAIETARLKQDVHTSVDTPFDHLVDEAKRKLTKQAH